MTDRQTKWTICMLGGDKCWFFNGVILTDHKDTFLIHDDSEDREILLFKNNIIWMKETR